MGSTPESSTPTVTPRPGLPATPRSRRSRATATCSAARTWGGAVAWAGDPAARTASAAEPATAIATARRSGAVSTTTTGAAPDGYRLGQRRADVGRELYGRGEDGRPTLPGRGGGLPVRDPATESTTYGPSRLDVAACRAWSVKAAAEVPGSASACRPRTGIWLAV